MNQRVSATLVMVFLALWALEEAVTGLLMGRLPPMQVIWMRFVVHLALVLVWFGARSPSALVRTSAPVLHLFRSLLLLGMPVCWLLAVKRGVDADTLLATFWLAPLFVAGLAAALLRERVPAVLWAATVLACAGAAAVIGPSRLSLPAPSLLVYPVGMALCFSLFVVCSAALRREPLRVTLFYAALGIAVLLAPLMPARWVSPSGTEWLLTACVALLGLLGLAALQQVLRNSRAAPVAPLLGMQLVFASAIGWFTGHDAFTRGDAVGVAALLGAATLVVALGVRRRVGMPRLHSELTSGLMPLREEVRR